VKTARWVVAALWCLSASACGGEEEEPPVTRAPRPAVRADTGAAGAASTFDSTALQREVFSYRGAGRDPFLSLLRSASLRPLVQDVRVAGITFDPQYPARSVAVLRDTTQNKRYAVRVGDEIGMLRIQEIRPDAVVVTLDEFGTQRQVVLAMKRREAANP